MMIDTMSTGAVCPAPPRGLTAVVVRLGVRSHPGAVKIRCATRQPINEWCTDLVWWNRSACLDQASLRDPAGCNEISLGWLGHPNPGGAGHQADQTPEVPRRWDPTRWVSIMPTASIRANMVVGPTNAKPSRRSARASATDSGDVVGIWCRSRGSGVRSGRKDQTNSARPPLSRSLTVAAALVIVALILARLRTMPASDIKRATSTAP